MTTTTAPRRARKRKKQRKLAPTLGPYVCNWIERNLIHAEGDYYGQPFRLLDYERAFIWRAYELLPNADRRYRRALWGLPSGNGKTEIAAALGCVEFAGPAVCLGFDTKGRPIPEQRLSPDIPVAAASFEQADILFGAARIMLGAKLGDNFDIYDTEILWRGRPGRMYRVAAKAGTNDGRRPTFFLADELHEWECTCAKPGGIHVRACKARVYTVLSKGRAKRRAAWELAISTAGWDLNSLLGDLYREGRRLEKGQGDDRFLFVWQQAEDDKFRFTNDRALRKAIRQSNPALGKFLSLDNVLADAAHMPEFEFRRYHLNQWVTAPDRWLPAGAWEGRAIKRGWPKAGTPVVLGFDGSFSGDSTALVGATIEEIPHEFVVARWEKPDGAKDWRVDVMDAENAITEAFGRWNVRWLGCDPYRWQRTIAVLTERGFPVLEWGSHLPSRMVPACKQLYDAVMDARLTHDGSEDMARHFANCVVKIDSRGPRVTKDHRDSVRRIDLAVAAIIAYDLAVRALNAHDEGDAWRPV